MGLRLSDVKFAAVITSIGAALGAIVGWITYKNEGEDFLG